MSYKEQRPRICPEFVYLFPTRNHIVLILGIHIIIWGPRHRSCLVFHTNCDVPVVGGGGWLISYSPGHGLFLKKEFSEAFFREGERLILKMPTERIKEDPRRIHGGGRETGRGWGPGSSGKSCWERRARLCRCYRESVRQDSSSHRKELLRHP